MANWTERSFPGCLMLTMARHMPEPPVPAPRPLKWGEEDVLRQRLGLHSEDLRIERHALCMAYASPEEMWEFMQRVNGPLVAARMLLADRYDAFAEEALRKIEAIGEHREGRFVVESEYLVATARPALRARGTNSSGPEMAGAPAGPRSRART